MKGRKLYVLETLCVECHKRIRSVPTHTRVSGFSWGLCEDCFKPTMEKIENHCQETSQVGTFNNGL
jgi:predicted amidophosphoribosyltransferase